MWRFVVILTTVVLTICGLISGFFLFQIGSWNSSFNPEILLEKYTAEEIDHFALFAFQDDRLIKWKDDIRVGFKTDLTDDDLQHVRESVMNCVAQLNELLEEIQITIDSTNYNLTFELTDYIEYGVTGRAPTTISPTRIPYPTITNGEIYVVEKDRTKEDVNSTIYHEFSHILGFHHNPEKYRRPILGIDYKTIFNPTTRSFNDSMGEFVADYSDYTDLDKAAIRIMYDEDVDIDPGLTNKKFYRLIEKANNE